VAKWGRFLSLQGRGARRIGRGKENSDWEKVLRDTAIFTDQTRTEISKAQQKIRNFSLVGPEPNVNIGKKKKGQTKAQESHRLEKGSKSNGAKHETQSRAGNQNGQKSGLGTEGRWGNRIAL